MNCCCALLRFVILLLKTSVYTGNNGTIYVRWRCLIRMSSPLTNSCIVIQKNMKVNGILWFVLSDFIPRGLATCAFIRLMASRATAPPPEQTTDRVITLRQARRRNTVEVSWTRRLHGWHKDTLCHNHNHVNIAIAMEKDLLYDACMDAVCHAAAWPPIIWLFCSFRNYQMMWK